MHYKNGREAKNGDKVVLLPSWGAPFIGILYDAVAGNDHCNGRLAPCHTNDPMPNLQECLHWEDVRRAIDAPQQCVCTTGTEPTPVNQADINAKVV